MKKILIVSLRLVISCRHGVKFISDSYLVHLLEGNHGFDLGQVGGLDVLVEGVGKVSARAIRRTDLEHHLG